MERLRETYELPDRPPAAFKQWMVMLAVPAIALLLWLILPDSPVVVALLAIVALGAVFAGVAGVLRSRDLHKRPGRHPVPPPSVD